MPLDDPVIAISATFTAEAIEPGLEFWVRELGLDYEIRFAGYNLLFQELLDPAGLFARNSGINVALVRLDDWRAAGVDAQVCRLIDAVREASRRMTAPLVVAITPVSPELEAAAEVLRAGLAGLSAVYVIAAADVLSHYPVDEVHDRHAEELGHVPYTPLFFAALATAVARQLHSITAAPFKLIALDCDDTLWAGICGEDGPQNVVLDPPRRFLQEFVAQRRQTGMLLALCSKNNEEDVVETFAAHPDMPLRLDEFVARRVNWESKGANLLELAAELELGIDSFLLVDDNPKECEEARSGAPGVTVLPLPPEPSDIPSFLQHVWAFDRPRVTEEDRRRSAMYAERAARASAQRAAPSLAEFLETLHLEVTIAPLVPADTARVAQLTQRTNQMNASCRRRTEAEIRTLGGAECLTIRVQDRFGSYGLTGVAIYEMRSDALRVDTFLLSCRALGRGVEHRMIARLGEIAMERGLSAVEIPFVSGSRNRPAALFLLSVTKAGEDGVFRLAAREAAAVKYTAGETLEPLVQTEEVPKSGAERRIDYVRIATELRTPQAVLERIRATTRRSGPTAGDPPRTPLERDLAEIWAGLLNLESVGVHDNFFESGGHSLLAVQLLSRVRQIYGVDLSLEVVYSGEFTVAELAKAVELKEIEQGGADYQDLLAELEGLSDDEVRALLAEEQDAS